MTTASPPDEPVRLLAPDGALLGESSLDVDSVRDLYRAMVEARTYDRKCSAMQRQGRLATYAQFEGQEAAQIGAAAALSDGDWLVGTYRDAAAMWHHGYPWVNLILGRTGDERGGHVPAGVTVLPPSIVVGAHMIHAVGLGWAEQLKGSGAVAMTFFGDGSTSEGDFHEAMNFAGVYATPTVFVCENNGWAISMPTDRQTASASIAAKADAYGMPGVRVDGNDLLAVHAAGAVGVARARAGEGPTLIEAVTYRIGAHTSADDAGRYRTEESTTDWRSRDPLERVRLYLEAHNAWDQPWEDQVVAGASEQVEAAVAEAEALTPFDAGEIFDAVFAEPTAPLAEQRRRSEAEAT